MLVKLGNFFEANSYLRGVPGVRVDPPVRARGKLAPEISGIKIKLG